MGREPTSLLKFRARFSFTMPSEDAKKASTRETKWRSSPESLSQS